MDAYIVTEEASGYCRGVFTTERKALRAAEIALRDGFSCKVQSIIMNGVIRHEAHEQEPTTAIQSAERPKEES